ncbi:MAG: hypothetical protein IPH20_21245 [Bacteroidales bacterium]|nr:hypothetical protein [Bacteroidales bacterium]
MTIPRSGRIKCLVLYLRTYILLVFIFFSFSFLSCLLPDKPIRKNIERSVPFFEGISEYPEPMITGKKHGLDYFTDGMILNMIYTSDNREPLKSALLGRSRQQAGPYTTQVNQLKYSIANNNLKPNVEYARYWHGNTFFYRFFFLFTEYNELKWLIYFITSLLLVTFTIVLYRNMGGPMTTALMAGLFFVNIYPMQFSMHLSPVLIVAIISCLVLSYKFKNKPDAIPLVFFITGAVVSYFDLLTAPLLTLGLPMLLWVSLVTKNNLKSFRHSLYQLLQFGVLWALAYLATWGIKWIITWPFIDYDLFGDVKNQILLRSASVENSRISAIVINFNQLPLVIINLILIILIFLSAFHFNSKGIKAALLYLSVAVLPFIWFIGTANQSYYHFWFTYRILGITVGGVFLAIISLISRDEFSGNRVNRWIKSKFSSTKPSW